MRKHPVISSLLFGFAALGASSASVAQLSGPPSIKFQVQNSVTAVPALGEWGLILLSALLLVGAFFFFKNAKRGAGKLLSVFVGLLAVGMLSTHHDLISKAWADAFFSASFNQSGTEVELTEGEGHYAITNPGPNPVRITGFDDGGSCGTNGNTLGSLEQPIRLAALDNETLFDGGPGLGQPIRLAQTLDAVWQILPADVDGCNNGDIVQAGDTCSVDLSCYDPNDD